MKKAMVVLIAFTFLITPLAYAQVSRNASPATVGHEGRTNFTNMGLTGLDQTGNPSYFVLTGAGWYSDGKPVEYYLWVDRANNLCVASYPRIYQAASFPNGNWKDMPCTVVGSQS